ncbi:HpcH/HpaI aldolase/citrate lyase family protein [Psychrobacter sp. I-STPA10]|uniref:HpcH/HpaI aldolase/citrate lyase family protein n=1 Tax=Psychrobacter sp. I-STPA10 TaxID=2585769 RepID=UPI001E3E7EC3|nr:CoA ester lyase [Psychrobacter sp. I-STPA10]
MSQAVNLPNTWLFVPASKIERVPKAFASGAGAVIVDLEDAVAMAEKPQARQALLDYYQSDANDKYQPVWVRINQADSDEFAKDIELCQQMPNLAGIILPKAEHKHDIEQVHNRTKLPMIALVESALGLHQLDDMAQATGLVAFSYGFLDLCNDVGVQVDTPSAEIFANQVRYQLLITSKVHGLSAPIDTIYPDFNDADGLASRVQLWSQMGLSGMLCIHPKQVAVVQEALAPTQTELDFAKKVVDEYQHSGKAVFQIEGQMVDMPVIKRCQQLLANT